MDQTDPDELLKTAREFAIEKGISLTDAILIIELGSIEVMLDCIMENMEGRP